MTNIVLLKNENPVFNIGIFIYLNHFTLFL